MQRRQPPPPPGSGPRSQPPRDPPSGPGPEPEGLPALPLIRHLSAWLTPLLDRARASPDLIAVLSLLFGIGTWPAIGYGTSFWTIMGTLALVVCYVLDDCAGEVARAREGAFPFAARLRAFSGWIVHAGFFLVLGIGVYRATAQTLWIWLGAVAAAGVTATCLLGALRRRAESEAAETVEPAADEPEDSSAKARLWGRLKAVGETAYADFCFVALVLALAGILWILLPVAAIAAPLTWLIRLARGTRE